MRKIFIKADSKFPVDRKRLKLVASEFLNEQGVDEQLGLSIVVVGDRKMKELNERYLGVDKTTDVLSFSSVDDTDESTLEEPELDYLGDVVISWPQAVRQALERNKTVDEEIEFLLKHGLLHLLGIHHD